MGKENHRGKREVNKSGFGEHAGLMVPRTAETFKQRLHYCRILLKVHGFISEAISERIKQDIGNGRNAGKCKQKKRKMT